MKVVVTKLGFMGRLREPGDEFEVPEGVEASWFRPVEQKPRAKVGKKLEAPANWKHADDLV